MVRPTLNGTPYVQWYALRWMVRPTLDGTPYVGWLRTVGMGLSGPGPLGSCGLLVLDCPVPDLNYVGLRPPCVILGWAPEGAQPKITLNVGLRPPFAPAARFPVGPYLAPPRNLPLGELIGTSFGAVRGPIRPFWKIQSNPKSKNPIQSWVSHPGYPIQSWVSNPGYPIQSWLGLLGWPWLAWLSIASFRPRSPCLHHATTTPAAFGGRRGASRRGRCCWCRQGERGRYEARIAKQAKARQASQARDGWDI